MRLIHAEQMSLYNFIILKKKQWTQMKTKQLRQDISNQQESIGFPKPYSSFLFCLQPKPETLRKDTPEKISLFKSRA